MYVVGHYHVSMYVAKTSIELLSHQSTLQTELKITLKLSLN